MDYAPALPALPDAVAVVTMPAAIDLDSAGQVRATLTGALGPGIAVLVADMTATTWCALEGVQALVQARRAALAAGARLRLAGVQPAVRCTLERTGIARLLELYPSLDGAGRAGVPALTETRTRML